MITRNKISYRPHGNLLENANTASAIKNVISSSMITTKKELPNTPTLIKRNVNSSISKDPRVRKDVQEHFELFLLLTLER